MPNPFLIKETPFAFLIHIMGFCKVSIILIDFLLYTLMSNMQTVCFPVMYT